MQSGPFECARSGLERTVKRSTATTTLVVIAIAVMVALSPQAGGQDATTKYPSMAPIEQYLMDKPAEISLARSAAPEAISRGAEVLVLTRHGYEIAVSGGNGFVCIVERSWAAGIDEPDFWNPKVRAPICFNAVAAKSQIAEATRRTEWILAGQSKAQVFESLKAAIEKKELPAPEPGAMCYMMAKGGYLNDRGGHWHPHLMFFTPTADPATWGADLPGSPILSANEPAEHLTIFMVPVGHWSDGTFAPANEH